MIFKNRIKSFVWNRYHYISNSIYRLSSSSISQPDVKQEFVSGEQTATKNNEDKIEATTYTGTDILEPTEIKSLNIRERTEKYEKRGSLFKNLFLGNVDTDILSYPFLLKSREEFLRFTQQYEMVRKTWNKIKKDEETLDLLKYNSLYELSVSEMMYIFEAIGASVEKNLPFGTKEDQENRFEKRLSKTFSMEKMKDPFDIGETALQSFHNIRETIKTVVPLIERNAIVYYALSRSHNDNIKKILETKPKIAFAFDEETPDRTDLSINKWISEAKLSYDFKSWVIDGEKNRIIDREYSHYLVFSKANRLPEMEELKKIDNDVGIVGLLVPRDKVIVEHDFDDYFAIQHHKISFDTLELDRDQYEVVNATKDLSEYNNIKGCGQLAVSALILGLLKQLQKNTYAHLVNNRIGLVDCELVQYKLFQTTCKLYALESMIYLTAAMFDSFEKGVDLGGESITAKTLAIEYAYEIITELRSLFGSRYPFSSIIYDLIYYLDSYLDSSLHNRIFLGQEAARYYKAMEEFTLDRVRLIHRDPVYHIKNYLQQRKLRKYEAKLTHEMTKFIHHNMHTACDWIEHCVNLLQFSMHFLTQLYSKDNNINEKHFDLNRVTTMAMEIHMAISSISRANHSYCYGFRNNTVEKEICMAICKETFLKHLQIFETIDRRLMINNDDYARTVFEANLQERGYFPKLFQV